MKPKLQIYTTGAWLSPEYIKMPSHPDGGFWVWVVDSFDPNAPKFLNHEELCGGAEAVADTEAGLLPGYAEGEEGEEGEEEPATEF